MTEPGRDAVTFSELRWQFLDGLPVHTRKQHTAWLRVTLHLRADAFGVPVPAARAGVFRLGVVERYRVFYEIRADGSSVVWSLAPARPLWEPRQCPCPSPATG